MKDSAHEKLQIQHPWMDSIHHVVSGGRWNIKRILMVEEK
jgi:hypothetical protein